MERNLILRLMPASSKQVTGKVVFGLIRASESSRILAKYRLSFKACLLECCVAVGYEAWGWYTSGCQRAAFQIFAYGHSLTRGAKEMLGGNRPDMEIVGHEPQRIGRVKDREPYIAEIQARVGPSGLECIRSPQVYPRSLRFPLNKTPRSLSRSGRRYCLGIPGLDIGQTPEPSS